MRRMFSLKVRVVSVSYRCAVNASTQVALPLSRFVTTTLSSLYFDVTKDILYADALDSPRRREVLTILEQVKSIKSLPR